MIAGLRWSPRQEPLAIAAVAGAGPVKDRLGTAAASRVLAGADLRALRGHDWIVLLGQREDLPWADGATYVGWDGGVLVPTALMPSIAPDLLRKSLSRPAQELVVVVPGAILAGPAPIATLDPAALMPQ